MNGVRQQEPLVRDAPVSRHVAHVFVSPFVPFSFSGMLDLFGNHGTVTFDQNLVISRSEPVSQHHVAKHPKYA